MPIQKLVYYLSKRFAQIETINLDLTRYQIFRKKLKREFKNVYKKLEMYVYYDNSVL